MNYNEEAQDELKKALHVHMNTGIAKNVILFIGDGLGMTTHTAARIYKGQIQGMEKAAEEAVLSYEKFPFVGLSKVSITKHDRYCLYFDSVMYENDRPI